MPLNKLTWLGLIIAATGWSMRLLNAVASPEVSNLSNLMRSLATVTAKVSAIGEPSSMIVSGFGLAILGTLQSGFGALQCLFEAVLARSRRAQTQIATTDKRPLKSSGLEVAEQGWMSDRAHVRFANGTVQIENIARGAQFCLV